LGGPDLSNEDIIRLEGLQNEILEAIATGESFAAIAERLCCRVADLAPSALCSILTVDRDGLLHPLASPGLPPDFVGPLDGIKIGPSVGSCGTAAYTGESVIVTDIATDPLWAPYAEFALSFGMMACWSTPIKDRDGRVVATFAFYYRTKRGPSPLECQVVKACVHLCAIAIAQDEIRHRNRQLAYYDQLTGLQNRRRFDELFEARICVDDRPFGLLLVDVDHLKNVNDTLGHSAGDALIGEVARRLDGLDGSIVACRLGGDEFAILVDDCGDHDTLAAAARRLIEAVGMPFDCDGSVIIPQVTVGGVVFGIDGFSIDILRQNADFALYHGKETARGRYFPFEQGLRTSITERINTIRQIDMALAQERILTYYQPIVRLDTAEIVGLEALARKRRADGSVVSASAFQAALTDPKVAYELTDRMLMQVGRDVRRWIDMGIPFGHVGVNFAAADFAREDVELRLARAFESQRVDLSHVILEITETVHMGGLGNTVAKSVERLRSKGMRVALDDFGTGFASLTHLLSFPVDIIKIDRSFVDRMLVDRPSEVIIGSLIDLAAKLGMRIVAEGVECAAQHERLLALGCRLGQGYHFARPTDAATITKLLQLFSRRSPVDQSVSATSAA